MAEQKIRALMYVYHMTKQQNLPMSAWKRATSTAACILITGSLIHVIFELAGGYHAPLPSKLAPLFGALILICILINGRLNGYWTGWHPVSIVAFCLLVGVSYTGIYWLIANAGYLLIIVSIPMFFVQIIIESLMMGARLTTVTTCLAIVVIASTLEFSLFFDPHQKQLVWIDFLPSMHAIFPATSLQLTFFVVSIDKGKSFPASSSNIDDHF